MAIFGNFKGTTTSEFKIGKKESGSKISTGTRPSSDLSNGDVYFDSANATLDIYDTSWKNIGETLTELNVDDGTLFVNSTNDTVSIGSTASNERLFVNGNLRLGTNPSIQFSGSSLDLRHSNGTATQVRIRAVAVILYLKYMTQTTLTKSLKYKVVQPQLIMHTHFQQQTAQQAK
jgi:hypothetical protein